MVMKKDEQTRKAIDFFYSQGKVDNPGNNPEKAAALAIKAAVERNPTYKSGVTKKEKTEIHNSWTNLLIEKLGKYKECQEIDEFIRDVEDIYAKMNIAKYKKLFLNNGRGINKEYPKEFRIAHAQKSLSIFLKHMWCNNEDMPEPPVCPIDGVILKAVGSNVKWTKLNDIDEYKELLCKINDAANGKKMSIAKWELLMWNHQSGNESEVNQKEKKIQRNKQTNIAFPLPTNSNISVEPYMPFYKLNSNRIHHDEFVVGFIIPLKDVDSGKERQFMLFVVHRDDKTGYICQIRYCYDNINILDYQPFIEITKDVEGIKWERNSNALPTFKTVEFGKNKKAALCLMQNILKDVNAPQNVMEDIQKLIDKCR